MTQTNRHPLLSPNTGLRVLWGVIRFLLVSYAFMFGRAARRLRHAGALANRQRPPAAEGPSV